MKTFFLWFFAAFFGLAFTMAGIPSVWAQEGGSEEFTLEEVTVTAQKRAENLQKVPIQMDVISGEDLLGTGKDNVDDILRDISSVLINKSPDGMRVTVRGLADENSPFHDMHVSTPTVAVNIDGAFNSSSAAGQNLFDLERVEVLSGPQSTLYGSNSPGGIVNVVTASPKTDRFSASASAEVGNYGLFDGQAMVNAPIIRDLLAMRLAVQKYKRDSWIDGGDNSQDTTTARLKTKIQPTENFSATVTLNYSEAISGGRLGGDVKIFDYQDGHYWDDGTPVTNPWTAPDTGGAPPPPPGPPGPPSDGTVVGDAPNAMQQTAETKGIQAEISWDTAFGSISFVPSYNEQVSKEIRDDVEVVTSNGTDYTTQLSENHTEQKNAELRLASPEDFFFKWIVGGTYYESDRADFREDYYYPSNNSSNNATQKNKALYANITYPLTDRFRGTVGYRRSWDEVGNVEKPPKVGDGVSGMKYSNPDYKLGAEYDLAENTMLFANWATSYRINAMAVSQGNKTVPPEELKSYTVGVKNRFFDNRLQLNASAFFYDYQNKSFRGSEEGRFGGAPGADVVIREADWPHIDPDTGEDLPGTDLNNDGDYIDTNLEPDDPRKEAWESSDLVGMDITDPWIQQYGEFESFGVDVSADWLITSKDRLNLSLSYLDAEWTDAVVEFYWSWIWPTNGLDLSGRTNTFSPKWSGRASYEHNFTLGSLGTLIPQVDVSWQSSYELTFEKDFYPYNHQESHYILNGSIAFNHSSGMWSVNAYVKNATNYAVKNFWMDMAGSYSLGLNDPRTYGAVLSVKF